MKFIAHRGYSAKYPENTLTAFDAAVRYAEHDKRLVGIELDIRLTRDNRVAVFHDGAVKTGDATVPVEQMTLSELRQGVKDRLCGETVPELDAVLDLVQHRLELWIEIKDAAYEKKVPMDSLEKSLSRYASGGDIILHSFSPAVMRLAIDRFNRGAYMRFGALVSNPEHLNGFGSDLLKQMDLMHPNWRYLLEAEETFLTLGKPLMVWTIDRDEDMAALVSKTDRIACAGLPVTVATNDLLLLQRTRL